MFYRNVSNELPANIQAVTSQNTVNKSRSRIIGGTGCPLALMSAVTE
jgi:hypothetical protein